MGIDLWTGCLLKCTKYILKIKIEQSSGMMEASLRLNQSVVYL